MNKARQAIRWLIPRDRVPYANIEPDIYEARYKDRCRCLGTFIKHEVKPLVINSCAMVLEIDAKGPYKAVWKLFWHYLKADCRSFRAYWWERLKHWGLRLRGWDEFSIFMQQEVEFERDAEADDV